MSPRGIRPWLIRVKERARASKTQGALLSTFSRLLSAWVLPVVLPASRALTPQEALIRTAPTHVLGMHIRYGTLCTLRCTFTLTATLTLTLASLGHPGHRVAGVGSRWDLLFAARRAMSPGGWKVVAT